MTLDDLDHQNRSFIRPTCLRFLPTTPISRVNCDEMNGDRPGQFAYEIFSNVDFNRLSFNFLQVQN